MLKRLLKLMKYELKCTYRSFGLAFLVIIGVSFFISPENDSSTIPVILMLIYGLTIGTLCVMIFVTIIRNFYQSMFQKSGYLTQTLPVKSYELVLSKMLISFFWIAVSVIVIIASTFIIAFRASNASFNEILDALGHIISATASTDFLFMMLFCIVMPLQMICMFYMIMSAVHTKFVRKHRVMVAVILYFVLNYVIDWITGNTVNITSGVFGVTYYTNTSVMSFYSESQAWLQLGISLVLGIAYFVATCYLLDNKLEIE